MNLTDAYKIVYDDLINNGPNIFKGKYDAENGSTKYMYGISTVLEYIANKIDDKTYDNFSNLFIQNMIKGKHRE